jgi:hypothetical protein
MSTETATPAVPFASAIPPDVRADLDAILKALAAGQKPDPELVRRASERADQAREEVFKRNGVLNVAVDLIREGRDEE